MTAPTTRPAKKSRGGGGAYRARFAAVLGAIGLFRSIAPLCWLYLGYSLLYLGVAGAGFSRTLLSAYCATEVIFSIVYRRMAMSVSARRPPTTYQHRYLRDVVKKVLESNVQSAGSIDSPEDTFDTFQKDTFAAADRQSRLRRRTRTKSRMNSVSSSAGSHSPFSSASSSATNLQRSGSSDSLRSDFTEPEEEDTDSTDDCEPSVPLPSDYNFTSPKLSFDDPRAREFRDKARNWFHGARFEDLCREEACQWMSWSLYNQPYEELVEQRSQSTTTFAAEPEDGDVGRDKLESVEISVDLWEARAGVHLPSGKAADVDVMRLTLDPVRVSARPLLLYGLVWLAQVVHRRHMKHLGFKVKTYGGLKYLIRIPRGWTSAGVISEAQRPLLFLHGLGLGPVQYGRVLNSFATRKEFEERPLAILLQPHLSMSIFDKAYLSPPNSETCAKSFASMVKACRFSTSGVTVVSHSNGTIVHGWLVKSAGSLIRRSCFIDPVCFALWEPSLPFNFLYAPTKAPMQFLTRYFVARELGVANMLQRNFDWIASNVFPSDIPGIGDKSKAAIFLSERDAIVDTPSISSYLESEGLHEGNGVKVLPRHKHGEALMKGGSSFKNILAWVEGKC